MIKIFSDESGGYIENPESQQYYYVRSFIFIKDTEVTKLETIVSSFIGKINSVREGNNRINELKFSELSSQQRIDFIKELEVVDFKFLIFFSRLDSFNFESHNVSRDLEEFIAKDSF